MILMTMLARVVDGLPLAASVGDDEDGDQNLVRYTNQAKLLFRKLDHQTPSKCSLDSPPYMFHYIVDSGVCYLCLCDKNFPEKLAFTYLEDLRTEFSTHYGRKVDQATRPYNFIEFDSYIQTAKRKYGDFRARQNLSHIGAELQDVQRIMVKNIDDVIHRGEALTMLDDKAAKISVLSKKYREDARKLNLRSLYMKIGVVVLLVVLVLLYFRFWW